MTAILFLTWDPFANRELHPSVGLADPSSTKTKSPVISNADGPQSGNPAAYWPPMRSGWFSRTYALWAPSHKYTCIRGGEPSAGDDILALFLPSKSWPSARI